MGNLSVSRSVAIIMIIESTILYILSAEMDIKNFLPCKKLRRSNRLEEKEKVMPQQIKTRIMPLGYFDLLPLELKFYILKFLCGNP